MADGETRWICAGRTIREGGADRFLVVATYRIVAVADDAIECAIESGTRDAALIGRHFWWTRSQLRANIALGECKITNVRPQAVQALGGGNQSYGDDTPAKAKAKAKRRGG